MSIIAQLQNAKSLNKIVSDTIYVRQLPELTYDMCQRTDVPSSVWIIPKLWELTDMTNDLIYIGSINVIVQDGSAFDPTAIRTVVVGQGIMTFVTLLSCELLRLLSPVLADNKSAHNKKLLDDLVTMLITETGERRLTITNEVANKALDTFISSALEAHKNRKFNKIFIPTNLNKDEMSIFDCYAEIKGFFVHLDSFDTPLCQDSCRLPSEILC